VKTVRRIARRPLLRRGLPIAVSAPERARVSAVLDTADLVESLDRTGHPTRRERCRAAGA